jgi:uroporphyrinogen-III synthase
MNFPTVLVIQADGTFSALLREAGCRVLNLEVVRATPIEDLSDFTATVQRIDEYDGLFVTSPVAARVLVDQLKASGRDLNAKVYVLGERAREVLDLSGLNVLFRSSANTASELIEAIGRDEFAGKKLLFIRGDRSMRTIPELLSENARIDEIVVYRTIDVPPDEKELKTILAQLTDGVIRWVCFFSPSGVEGFLKAVGNESIGRAAVATIGETTDKRARDAGLPVNFVSPKATAKDFAVSLMERIKNID